MRATIGFHKRGDLRMTRKHKLWALMPALPKDLLVASVRQYEDAGLEGVWSPQLYGAPFVPLAAAAAVSDRLKLGTGVALAFVRSPLETASCALDLDMISGGRAVLGIGPSIKWWNEDWYGVRYGKPLAHLREVIGAVRQIIAKGHTGELGRIDGEYVKLDLERFKLLAPPLRTAIPIYIPAVFEKTCEMAGEIADGLPGHPIWNAKWVRDKVAPHLANGLARSGRARKNFDLNLFLFVAVNEDKRQAIEDARETIAFYGQMAQYEAYYEYIGFGSEARALQAAGARQDHAAMMAACSDEMVESIVLTGTPDEVRRRLDAMADIADSFTLSIPFYGLAPDKAAYYTQRIAEVFYG
jgi:probable F420-dependent oxidoreductase